MAATATKSKGKGKRTVEVKDTLVSILLDRSGSMNSCWDSTIAGFNDFVKEQRKLTEAGDAKLSLVQFDTQYEPNFIAEDIANVPELDKESYVPRGGTALHRSLVKAISETEEWVAANKWEGNILFVVITDGQENSSGPGFDLAKVTELIDRKESEGWNFAYMGANVDAYAVGQAMGIPGDNSFQYDSTPEGMTNASVSLTNATNAYRQTGGATGQSFFAQEVPSGSKPPKVVSPPSGTLKPKKK